MTKSPWPSSTAANRWYAFGRYYAMFPVDFAYEAINGLTDKGEYVVDPFCGRGNAPFTATVLARPTVAVDINPLAWLYTSVKLAPELSTEGVLSRLEEMGKASTKRDRRAQNKFEAMAWSPAARSFLKAARRELDWQSNVVDRTLMGFVALHMQDKRGAGLSNTLWPTLACSPSYAVRWWTQKGMTKPPDVDPVKLLSAKIRRRYAHGIAPLAEGIALRGDAARELPKLNGVSGSLLITSPPYNGVTDYWNDHWIRLWLMGNEMRQDWKLSQRGRGNHGYRDMLFGVFAAARDHLRNDAAVLVRTDRRSNTADACLGVLKEIWPDREVLARQSEAPKVGVSNHHGRGGSKAREVDLFLPGNEKALEWATNAGFQFLGETP